MSLYRRADSDVWWMNISIVGLPRVRQSTETTNRRTALAVEAKTRAELSAALQRAGPVDKTWDDAVAMWARKKDRSESDVLSLKKLSSALKKRLLIDLTSEDFEQALEFCETEATFNRYRARIVAIMNLAKRHKWIAEVPYIETRGIRPKERRWLTRHEWSQLYAALPSHLKGPAMVAVQTGLRQANVFGLKWKDVDLDRGHVVVAAANTKAGKSIAVPLNAAAVQAIQAEAGKHHEFVFTYRGKPMAKPKEGFAQALRNSHLPDFTWHGLRHTWATWHIQNGTPVDVLQKLGGWSDMRMVMNYAHHSAGYLATYANNVEK
jgi:integrase